MCSMVQIFPMILFQFLFFCPNFWFPSDLQLFDSKLLKDYIYEHVWYVKYIYRRLRLNIWFSHVSSKTIYIYIYLYFFNFHKRYISVFKAHTFIYIYERIYINISIGHVHLTVVFLVASFLQFCLKVSNISTAVSPTVAIYIQWEYNYIPTI